MVVIAPQKYKHKLEIQKKHKKVTVENKKQKNTQCKNNKKMQGALELVL